MIQFCGISLSPDVPEARGQTIVDAMLTCRASGVFQTTNHTVGPDLVVGVATPVARAGPAGMAIDDSDAAQSVAFGAAAIYEGGATAENALSFLHAAILLQGDPGAISGDFAAGIYDRATRSLRFLRDHVGVEAVYYRQVPEGLIFANNAHFLTVQVLPRVDVDPFQLAVFAATRRTSPGRFPVAEINVLPPAHEMLVQRGEAGRVRRYWSLQSTDDHGLRRRDECVAHVRQAFEAAVDRRLADARRPAIALSGGLDSSAIAGAAAVLGEHAEIIALSHVGEGAVVSDDQNDDRPFIDAVLRHLPALSPVSFSSAGVDLLAGPDDSFSQGMMLSHAPNHAGNIALANSTGEAGADVLINGFLGDCFLSNFGQEILCEALGRGDVVTAWRELSRRRAARGEGRLQLMRSSLLDLLLPGSLRARRKEIRRNRLLGRLSISPDWTGNQTFVHALDQSTATETVEPATSVKMSILQALDAGLEQDLVHQNRSGSGHAFVTRSPMADIHLLKAIYWTPGRHFASAQRDRQLIRDVAKPYLPEKVLNRDGKAPFMPDFDARLEASMERLAVTVKEALDHGSLDTVFDKAALKATVDWALEKNGSNAARSEFIDVIFKLYLPFSIARYLEQIRSLGSEGS
ncbi:MAG: asparagine synthase-related protein [Pseudomonadota bacterium]